MVNINENYLKLKAGYLFPEIERRVRDYQSAHPNQKIIRMGIGDVTRPLVPAVIEAFQEAVNEMGKAESFRGYRSDQGYEFLREAIVDNDFLQRGVNINMDEVFISDGSKCDTGNILDIFGHNNKVAISDPVFPVYIDTNVMDGRTGNCTENGYYEGVEYLPCNEKNNFVPELPERKVDIIYLCYPNNPTGMAIGKAELKKWVKYALENKAVILYDSAYEAYISAPSIPHSIYEIEDARKVAIEFRSFSKTAGFTGTRCAYTIIPGELMAFDSAGRSHSVHDIMEQEAEHKIQWRVLSCSEGCCCCFHKERTIGNP